MTTSLQEESSLEAMGAFDLPTKVFIQRGAKDGEDGYLVGLIGNEPLFFPTLEEALRRVISLLGLEGRDLMILDSIPGVLMDDGLAA